MAKTSMSTNISYSPTAQWEPGGTMPYGTTQLGLGQLGTAQTSTQASTASGIEQGPFFNPFGVGLSGYTTQGPIEQAAAARTDTLTKQHIAQLLQLMAQQHSMFTQHHYSYNGLWEDAEEPKPLQTQTLSAKDREDLEKALPF